MNKTDEMKVKIGSDTLEWTIGKVKGFYAKQFINLDSGTVKLVRVDAKADYPLHRHPDKTEYAFVVDGNIDFTIGNETYSGASGDFFIFEKMTMHAIHNRTDKAGTLLIGAIKEDKIDEDYGSRKR